MNTTLIGPHDPLLDPARTMEERELVYTERDRASSIPLSASLSLRAVTYTIAAKEAISGTKSLGIGKYLPLGALALVSLIVLPTITIAETAIRLLLATAAAVVLFIPLYLYSLYQGEPATGGLDLMAPMATSMILNFNIVPLGVELSRDILFDSDETKDVSYIDERGLLFETKLFFSDYE